MVLQALTPGGQRIVNEVAQRHGVSTDAVINLLYALVAGGGTMAQFNHPDLGGMGQWSQGGMIMVGDMFNNGLKYRIDALCNDLANVLRANMVFVPYASSQSQSQGSGQGWNQNYQARGNYPAEGNGGNGNVRLFVPGSGGPLGRNWWPVELGNPSSTAAQNNLSYAVFPGTRRLAIQNNGQITVYDIGDHNIGGFSQQQSGDQSLTFTSQYGLIRVADLPIVSSNGSSAFTENPNANFADPPPPQQFAPPMQPSPGSDDIFNLIEQLANLRQKGVLTDEEFSAKKAELLSRI